MEDLGFTDDEIREQLANLGYFDVSETRLKQFRKDLQRLVEHDRSSGSSSWFTGISSPSTNSDESPLTSQPRQHSPTKPSLSMKPSLSRYQPHLQVSPRSVDPSLLATSSHVRDISYDYLSDGGAHTSPETRLKTLTLGDSPPSGSEESPLSQLGHDYTETVTTSNDPTSNHATTSSFREHAIISDLNDDVIAHHHEDESDNFTEPHLNGSCHPTMSPLDLPSSSERKVVRRRKVSRKQDNGESAIFDESLVADGETSYRIHDISVDDMSVYYDRARMPPTLPVRPHTARPAGKRSSDQESVKGFPLPSYIRPNTTHPHMRNIRKTDPVNRHRQYQDAWNTIKAPGERSHKELRWEVKAQMMYKDEPQPKPQRVYLPNTYVVPTSKKRSALRWEVRHALERGMPVPSTFTVM